MGTYFVNENIVFYNSYMKTGAYFVDQDGIFNILYMKIWVYISYMKIEFSVFHIE